MLSKNILGLTVVSCLLVACSDDNDDTPAKNAYTGGFDMATISQDNAARFPRSAFAARDYAVSSAGIERWLAGAAGAETVDCAGGGKAEISRSINMETMLGSKTLTFSDNCTVNNHSLSGSMTLNVSAYDMQAQQATATNVSYHGLRLINGEHAVTLTGTMHASQNLTAKTVDLDIHLNLKADSGEEALTDMQVVVNGDTHTRSAHSTYNGQVCLKNGGCTILTTIQPFHVNFNGYTTAGLMLVTGAENEAQVVAAQGSSAFARVSMVE